MAKKKLTPWQKTYAPRWEKIRAYIQAEPLRYEQEDWRLDNDDVAPCGTAACLGGTADILFGETDEDGIRLGVNNIVFAVFPQYHWPEPFRSQWKRTLKLKTVPSRRRAQACIVTCKGGFIDYIIQCEGKLDGKEGYNG